MITAFAEAYSYKTKSKKATVLRGVIVPEISKLSKEQALKNVPVGSKDEGAPRVQKIKSGLLFKLTMGLGIFSIICTLAIPNPKHQTINDIQKIEEASFDEINTRNLAIILNNQNIDVGDQEEILEKEIQGKIVEWELEILVVANLPDHYKILTKPTSKYPGTLLTLYPQNSQQVTYMDNVVPGSRIRIKGKIAGILQGRIQINPTLLI